MWSKPRNGRNARAAPHGRDKKAGFTLLEVVVATTLMAVLMVILVTGLRLGANAWHRGNQQLTAHARSLAGVEALNLQIASAVPKMLLEQSDRGQRRYVNFRGTPSEVRFLARLSWARDRSRGLWLARYRVAETQAGQQQLVISELGVLDDRQLLKVFLGEAAPAVRTELLGDPAERIGFSYLQLASAQSPAVWVSEWRAEERDELPRGVRVQWRRDDKWETLTFLIPEVRGEK